MNYRVKEFLDFEGQEVSLEKKSMLISPYDVRLVIRYFEEEKRKEMNKKEENKCLFSKDELQTVLFLIDKYEEEEFDKGYGVESQFWRIRNKIKSISKLEDSK